MSTTNLLALTSRMEPGEFAKALKRERKRLRMSRLQIASIFGINATTIYIWETGKYQPRYLQRVFIETLKQCTPLSEEDSRYGKRGRPGK